MAKGLLLLLATVMVSVPAFGQVDFSGEWAQLRHEDSITSAEVGDYLGVPLNAAGRARVDNFNATIWSLPEWQCRPHGAPYFWRGTGETRVTKVVDPVTRDTTAFRVERRRNFDVLVYLDGRPHPPEYAAHTWGGFSTGKWDGDVLTITTTHLKEGYIKTNGIPYSDKTTVTERWIRKDDLFFVIQTINDPVYMEEPYVVSMQHRLNPRQTVPITPCVVIEESTNAKGAVPQFMPGENPYRTEFADRYKIPSEVMVDGAKLMYPEYQAKIREYQSKSKPSN